MRTIKFRAWHPLAKEMWSHDEIFIENDSINPMDWHKEHKWYLMQFTGLTDKNGKEIYEGDLLKGDNFIYRVWAVQGGFAININVGKWHNDIMLEYPFPLQPLADEQTVSYVSNSCEVIGNIYENAELLKR